MSSEQDISTGDELPAGFQLCGGQYVIERYLNAGGFGITYLARDSLNRRVVIKECFPGAMCCRTSGTVRLRSSNTDTEFEAILELFEKEARALSELRHPYIVGVHQIFHDNGTAYMAMDYVEGRNLLEIIDEEPDRFSPQQVRRLLVQLLEAITYIHSHDILHRDISPDNILIGADNNPVMIDFGAARESATRVSRVLSKVLTVKDGYSPQEFYLQGSTQEFSSDLYALAATMFHLVGKEAPPSSHIRMAAIARKSDDPLVLLPTDLNGYDAEFLEAINQCLSIFPKDRLQSADLWRDAIDLDRRREVLLEAAQDDRNLEERVAQLVAEFQEAVRADRAWAAGAEPRKTKPDVGPATTRSSEPDFAETVMRDLYPDGLDKPAKAGSDPSAAKAKGAAPAAPSAAPPAEGTPEPSPQACTDADPAAPTHGKAAAPAVKLAKTVPKQGAKAKGSEAGVFRRLLTGKRAAIPGLNKLRHE